MSDTVRIQYTFDDDEGMIRDDIERAVVDFARELRRANRMESANTLERAFGDIYASTESGYIYDTIGIEVDECIVYHCKTALEREASRHVQHPRTMFGGFYDVIVEATEQ